MAWDIQQPAAPDWTQESARPYPWGRADPFADQTFWDIALGFTVWDISLGGTRWDYAPVEFDEWEKVAA